MGDVFNQRKAVRAVFNAPLRASEKLVMLAIIDHWSKKYPKPSPGLARLMKLSGLARQTVISAINDLVTIGAIPKPERGARGAYLFDLSRLVSNLDQWDGKRPVRNLDRSKSRTGLNRSRDRSKSRTRSGLVASTNPQQNGSNSSEESKESIEESSILDANAPTLTLETPKAKEPTLYQRVVAGYVEAFEAKHGCKPTFGNVEGKHVKTLLVKLKDDADEALRRINNAFGSWRGDSVTIANIATNPDSFIERDNKNGAKRGPVQHHGTDVLSKARNI